MVCLGEQFTKKEKTNSTTYMLFGLSTQTDQFNTSVSIQFCQNDVNQNPLNQNCTYVDLIDIL
jgi:hypothetical protein